MQRTKAVLRISLTQWDQILGVHFLNHSDTQRFRAPLRRHLLGIIECPRIVAEDTVHTQRVTDIIHQRIGAFCILNARHIRIGDVFIAPAFQTVHPNHFTIYQILLKRIRGQRAVLAERRYPVLVRRPSRSRRVDRRHFEPNIAGDILSPVTGHAGHTNFFIGVDMTIPVFVDILGHLDHPAGHNFGVECIFTIGFDIAIPVTISAAFFGRYPAGHRRHHPVEVILCDIPQHLHVFIDVFCQRIASLRDIRLILDQLGNIRIRNSQFGFKFRH